MKYSLMNLLADAAAGAPAEEISGAALMYIGTIPAYSRGDYASVTYTFVKKH